MAFREQAGGSGWGREVTQAGPPIAVQTLDKRTRALDGSRATCFPSKLTASQSWGKYGNISTNTTVLQNQPIWLQSHLPPRPRIHVMKKQLGVNQCNSLSYDLHKDRKMPHGNTSRSGCLPGLGVASPDRWESEGCFAQQGKEMQ